MQRSVVAVLAWLPLTVVLFRLVGPRKAVLISVLGGYVFLPAQRMGWGEVPTDLQLLWKGITTGLGLILGVVLFDRPTLRRFRPVWADLPMFAYAVYPLIGLAMGGPSASHDVLEMVAQRTLAWLVPYLAGRMYFGDATGSQQVASGLVIATLAHAPVVFWEALMGPQWFAMTWVYGIPTLVEDRLGGWTPQGFMMRRLELAAWSSMAAATAVYLWAGGGWRPKRGPAWWPCLVLIIAALLTRSVYGYLTLGVGLVVSLLTVALRTRVVLVALAAVTPLYVASRMLDVPSTETLVQEAKEALPNRYNTVVLRLQAEADKLERLTPPQKILGRGLRVWNAQFAVPDFLYPDGQWAQVLWEGGLVGLSLYYVAVHLWPAGAALSRPRGRPRRQEIGAPSWSLALFTLLLMFEGLHNSAPTYPGGLIAGTLVAQVLTASAPWRRGSSGSWGEERETAQEPRSGAAAGGLAPMPASVPAVSAFACVLYVFGHGPVEGFEPAKLIGGLGAALLFASAGGLAAWAAPRFSSVRLALYGLLFGALGISFNLALHPRSRPVGASDIFQGLALCGTVVALWRRRFGSSLLGDSILSLTPLLVHFVVRPGASAFPGSVYLFGGSAETGSLFPLCPWLLFAAMGARAAVETTGFNLASAAAFSLAAAWLSLGPTGQPAQKFPMNLTYALLSGAAVGFAFALARVANAWEPARRAARWLSGRWPLFFYLHFAVAAGLGLLRISSPALVWPLMAVGGIAATWGVSTLAAPIATGLKKPLPWLVPAALIALAWFWPTKTPAVVAGLAGLGGLVFAAYWKELASVAANLGRSEVAGGTQRPSADTMRGREDSESRAHSRFDRDVPEPESVWQDDAEPLARLLTRGAILLGLLLLPELLQLVERQVTPGPSPSSLPSGRPPSSGAGPGRAQEPTGGTVAPVSGVPVSDTM